MKQHTVGIDIGGSKMYMIAAHEDNYIECKVPTGITCTKAYIKEQLNLFIDQLPFEVADIGIALPGLVGNEDTLQLSDVVPLLNGLHTDFLSEGRYNIKFINDVKAATLCEVANHKDAHTVAVVMSGTGIALGVAVEGNILQGSKGFAGEIGLAYIPYKEGVETFDYLASGATLLQKAKCGGDELRRRLEEGRQEACQLIKEAGYYFGVGLSLIIQFYNPDIIVVGGSTSTYPGYMEIARETVKKYTLPELFDCCQIVLPQDAQRIVALGAAKFTSQIFLHK